MELFAFDDDYVRRLRESDPPTVDHFYAYFTRLLPIKLRRMGLRTREEIEDVVQETFLRVFRKVGEVRDGRGFGAFVSRVAELVVFEYRRGDAWKTDSFDPDKHDRPREVRIEEELISAEISNMVLAQLDRRDADLLRSKFLDESDNDVLCLRFGCDAQYLRVLLFRARDRFRKEYEKRFGIQEARPLVAMKAGRK